MKFGLLKSKIEKKLLESYNKNTFKSEMANFKKLIISNKDVSKMFNYYNELSTNKGLSESETKEFIDETLSLIKQLKITENSLKDINKWVSEIKTKNEYKTIDDLVSEVSDVSKILKLKKTISENLIIKNQVDSQIVNVPLKSMVSIANKTLSKFLEKLNESEQKELNEIIKMTEKEIKENFKTIKEEVISKLKSHLENSDSESKEKITETISVIESKESNKVEFYKLKELSKSL